MELPSNSTNGDVVATAIVESSYANVPQGYGSSKNAVICQVDLGRQGVAWLWNMVTGLLQVAQTSGLVDDQECLMMEQWASRQVFIATHKIFIN
jgi:hypothetical protein